VKIQDLTKNEAVSLLELIHDATRCTQDNEIEILIGKLNRLVPFEKAGAMLGRVNLAGKITAVSVNHNYPDQFVDEYVKQRFHEIDPYVKDSFGVYDLQYWSDILKRYVEPRELYKGAFGLCRDFGLDATWEGKGYSCGIKNLNGDENGVLHYYGLSKRERHKTILSLFSPHLHEAMSRILGKARSDLPPLSSREKEILKWLMEGKSTWDISTILQISERTVKFHIDNTMKKLDAVNRTHAVAIALREKLVELC
jgi:DNA-binding CsgD family transcriptional regulator